MASMPLREKKFSDMIDKYVENKHNERIRKVLSGILLF